MSAQRIFIAAAGIISALGKGMGQSEASLRANRAALAPLSLFSVNQAQPLPVGQIHGLQASEKLPRTHQLVLEAADLVHPRPQPAPEAIILGCTTGGILRTEELLRQGSTDPQHYRFHGLHTVSEALANHVRCSGPVLTISTACSSSAVALALALRLLRQGKITRVLAGGVDSLCRLTYFGFHSLQLVDANGCKPFDVARKGMAVAEGAALLWLTTEPQAKPLAELLGAGLSCDAYHPATPQPQGEGAWAAMQAALADAGLQTQDIDYINLHGTGTKENDAAEAQAIRRLFAPPPPLSSIKGASGHSLAAAGAIEAAVACIALNKHFIPANTGCMQPDPVLGLDVELRPKDRPLKAILSNSFGFGGNNASLVISQARAYMKAEPTSRHVDYLAIHASACLSGAGWENATLAKMEQGLPCGGQVAEHEFTASLAPQLLRRVKRLAKIALALAHAISSKKGVNAAINAVFMGAGWGALSETHDFLERLRQTDEQFPSPTDFIGSVHNSAASQVAIMLGAKGANITASGAESSFAQALMAADLWLEAHSPPALVMAADEGHAFFSPLLDPSAQAQGQLADGGGAFLVDRRLTGARGLLRLLFAPRPASAEAVQGLAHALKHAASPEQDYGLVCVDLAAAQRSAGLAQLAAILGESAAPLPLFWHRDWIGEFASASAVAAVLTLSMLHRGHCPGLIIRRSGELDLRGKKALVIGLGASLSAMELALP